MKIKARKSKAQLCWGLILSSFSAQWACQKPENWLYSMQEAEPSTNTVVMEWKKRDAQEKKKNTTVGV